MNDSNEPLSRVRLQPRHASEERLHHLLVESSRTFALAIPQLPALLRREVTVSYLLFRIADTFEDASEAWSKKRQLDSLAEFERLLEDPFAVDVAKLTSSWLQDPPTRHPGYLELLQATPEVIASWVAFSEPSRSSIGQHTRRTTHLMADFVTRSDDDGVLQLADLADLRGYCYAVAGIVGEMLTELFLLRCPELAGVGEDLRQRAAPFGEGLQLVNILKDSAGDVVEGRNYLPGDVDRPEVFALARNDLEIAVEYCLLAQQAGAPGGVLAFIALPVELAWATLDRVEARGPGSKISRARVLRLHRRVQRAIEKGSPVLRERVSR